MQTNKSNPQRKANDLAARDRAVMREIQEEQEKRDKKTARLRALRLAKEASEKEAAITEEANRKLAAQRVLEPSSTRKNLSRRTKREAA
ncbi:MAG: hypothetical protein AAFO01_10200 [Pseudomonadota bacterium]